MYPHTVRTVGLGLIFSAYYLGAFLIQIYMIIKPTEPQVLEAFMLGSLITFMHTWGLRETMGKGLNYELKEI